MVEWVVQCAHLQCDCFPLREDLIRNEELNETDDIFESKSETIKSVVL